MSISRSLRMRVYLQLLFSHICFIGVRLLLLPFEHFLQLYDLIKFSLLEDKGNGASLMKPETKRRRTDAQKAADKAKAEADQQILANAPSQA